MKPIRKTPASNAMMPDITATIAAAAGVLVGMLKVIVPSVPATMIESAEVTLYDSCRDVPIDRVNEQCDQVGIQRVLRLQPGERGIGHVLGNRESRHRHAGDQVGPQPACGRIVRPQCRIGKTEPAGDAASGWPCCTGSCACHGVLNLRCKL